MVTTSVVLVNKLALLKIRPSIPLAWRFARSHLSEHDTTYILPMYILECVAFLLKKQTATTLHFRPISERSVKHPIASNLKERRVSRGGMRRMRREVRDLWWWQQRMADWVDL